MGGMARSGLDWSFQGLEFRLGLLVDSFLSDLWGQNGMHFGRF